MRAEAASTHGRLLTKLERALKRLADAPDDARATRLAEAGEALWFLTVQRDVMGFRNTDALLKSLDVPRAVILAMGARQPVNDANSGAENASKST